VPREFGGADFSLTEVASEQRRLAYRSPATAHAVNAHLCWTGAAAEAHRSGVESAGWLLREAADGAVFATAQPEPGGDPAPARPNVRAEPDPGGGYRLYSRKVFTSPPPAWTWLGLAALDLSSPGLPKTVHAFIGRRCPGYRPAQAAGASVTAPAGGHGAVLEGARAEPRHMTRVLPTGPPDDPFICATFGWAAQLCGTIYHAAAERAFDLAIGIAKWRAPNDNARPHIQWAIVGALLELEVISAHLAKLTGDQPSHGGHRGQWLVSLFAAKRGAVEGARHVAGLAAEPAAGATCAGAHELRRLCRGRRAGAFHMTPDPPAAAADAAAAG